MQFQFNAQNFEPSMGMEAWTDGWHPVILKSMEPKPNRDASTGGNLACVIEAIDGPMKGKQQFFTLNLWHQTSQQAVEIANKTLSAITYVTIGANQGRLNFNDTSELLNIPFMILATRQKDDPSRNEFRSFKDIRGNDPKGNNAGGGAPGGQPSFGAPQQPQSPAGAPAGAPQPQWGAPPAGGAPPQPQQPQQPPAGQPAWGAPPAGAPAQQPQQPPAGQPAWGASPQGGQPQQQPPQQQQQPQWGAPPQGGQPPAGAPAGQPAWGAPPNGAGAPQGQPQGQPAWGAPR